MIRLVIKKNAKKQHKMTGGSLRDNQATLLRAVRLLEGGEFLRSIGGVIKLSDRLPKYAINHHVGAKSLILLRKDVLEDSGKT